MINFAERTIYSPYDSIKVQHGSFLSVTNRVNIDEQRRVTAYIYSADISAIIILIDGYFRNNTNI